MNSSAACPLVPCSNFTTLLTFSCGCCSSLLPGCKLCEGCRVSAPDTYRTWHLVSMLLIKAYWLKEHFRKIAVKVKALRALASKRLISVSLSSLFLLPQLFLLPLSFLISFLSLFCHLIFTITVFRACFVMSWPHTGKRGNWAIWSLIMNSYSLWQFRETQMKKLIESCEIICQPEELPFLHSVHFFSVVVCVSVGQSLWMGYGFREVQKWGLGCWFTTAVIRLCG